jgi:ATP-binding cassette subfamily F protein uup
MTVLSVSGLVYGHGSPPLLDGIALGVSRGERVGLIGRNGTGKSSLLRLLAGELRLDAGEIRLAVGARVAALPQEVPADMGGSVEDRVAEGISADVPLESWERRRRVERLLEELRLDGPEDVDTLSAGAKRRVLLARALVGEPDLLLLDEPTNHLDIDAILGLEARLRSFRGALVFVTHDRAFLRGLATRIVEIVRGRSIDHATDYDTFLQRRDELLEAEARQEALFDKKLAQEEAWLRQGVKARRKRNEGRVRALMQMRRDRMERRSRPGTARMTAQEGERSGQRVVKAEGLSFRRGERWIVRDLDLEVMRGDRVGLVGPNGAGKTTLLKLLLGEIAADSGTLVRGTQLAVAYFDQLRAQLDPRKKVKDCVADGLEKLEIGGRQRHVLGYLEDFLFTPERARLEVGVLSGGERNRLLLARLFARPSNVLVLDEPTNDLDAETLELLEELLGDYAGTIFLVSHDRAFLNAVVTSTLAFEGGGSVMEYAGGWDDYVRLRPAAPAPAARAPAVPAAPPAPPGPRKLSYKERRELESLPARIESMEARVRELHARMSDPAWYRRSPETLGAEQEELARLEADVAAAYLRWAELEGG